MAINKRKILESAQKFLQKGALDKALKEYQTLLQADPRDSGSRLKVGDIHLKLGQKAEAVAQYTKVAEHFMKDGFDAKAVALYKQILKIDAQRADVHVPLAELYQRLGLTSEAMSALQTAADAYHREGKKHEALDLLRKMATLDPTNTASRTKIAELLRTAGLPDEAIAEYEEVAQELARHGESEQLVGVYERILELEPTRVTTMLALARLLLEAEQPERAEPHAKRAADARPDAIDGWELLAEVLRARGRDAALEPVHRKLVELYRARGDEDHAREIQQRYLTSEPLQLGSDDSGASFAGPSAPPPDDEVLDDRPSLRGGDAGEPLATPMGKDYDLTGGVDDQAFFETAAPLEGGGGSGVAPLAAAMPEADLEQLLAEASVYLRYGKHDKAVASLEAVLAQQPENRFALDKLGDAHVARGEAPRAVVLWARAARLAQSEGDDDAFEDLRARLATIAPDEAARLRLAPAPAAVPAGAAQTQFIAAEPAAPAPIADAGHTLVVFGGSGGPSGSMTPDGDGLPDPDLEIDLDPSLFEADMAPSIDTDDGGTSGAGAASPESVESAATPSAHEPDDSQETSGFELDLDVQRAEQSDADLPTSEISAADDTVSGSSPGASGTTPDQILEDLEEAEFYFHQALYDEAEAVYRRMLQVAPNHPQILLRLGEIAAARGDDPGSSATGLQPVSETPDALPSGPLESLESIESPEAMEPVDPADAAAEPIPALGSDLPDLPLELEGAASDEVTGDDPHEPVDDDRAELPREGLAELPLRDDVDLDLDLDIDPDVGGDAGGDDAREASQSEHSHVSAAATTDAWTLSQSGFETSLANEESSEPKDPLGLSDATPVAQDLPLDLDEDTDSDVEAAAPDEGPGEGTTAELSGAGLDLGLDEIAAEMRAESDAEELAAASPPDSDFDLAAELTEALASDEGRGAETPGGVGSLDDGFESVFREFKKGVQRTVGDADYETHYDLGIAYREMGLIDDAVGEFRLSMGSPVRCLDSLHMLGLCAIDSKRPQDAIAHLEQALAMPDVPVSQQVALRFDLGRARQEAGDLARALAELRAVAALDGGFQDVRERLLELERVVAAVEAADAAARVQEAPTTDLAEITAVELRDVVDDGGTPAAAETFESFDDLLAEAQAEAALSGDAALHAAPAPLAELPAEPPFDPDRHDPVCDATQVAEDEPQRVATTGAETPAPPALADTDVSSAVASEDALAAEIAPESEPTPEPGPSSAGKSAPSRRRKISFL